MADNHTPGPWQVAVNIENGQVLIVGSKDERIASIYSPRYEEDASIIVRAVNSYELMLDTLRMVQFSPDGYCPWCEGHNFHLTDCIIDATIRTSTGEN